MKEAVYQELENRSLNFEDIIGRVSLQFEALELALEKQAEQFEPEIRDLVRYALNNSGKKIRPLLVFLSGWEGADVVNDDLVMAGVVVELIHIATLVHDDILDEATVRRSSLTVNRKFGSKEAVLLGDALFSHALKLAAEFSNVEMGKLVSEGAKKVCTGEIIQTFNRGNLNFSLANYYRVIDLKTAELFYVSAILGARLSGYSKEYVEDMGSFARNLGIAYQIYDDLTDILGSESKIGKTLGTDLKSGKCTLPIILLFNKKKDEGKAFVEGLLSGEISKESLIKELLAMGIIEETRSIFHTILDKGILLIDNIKMSHLLRILLIFRGYCLFVLMNC